jgi:hypothetical protein
VNKKESRGAKSKIYPDGRGSALEFNISYFISSLLESRFSAEKFAEKFWEELVSS